MFRFKKPASLPLLALELAVSVFVVLLAAVVEPLITTVALRLMYEYLSFGCVDLPTYLLFICRPLNGAADEKGKADVGLILFDEDVLAFLEELIFLELRGDGEKDLFR